MKRELSLAQPFLPVPLRRFPLSGEELDCFLEPTSQQCTSRDVKISEVKFSEACLVSENLTLPKISRYTVYYERLQLVYIVYMCVRGIYYYTERLYIHVYSTQYMYMYNIPHDAFSMYRYSNYSVASIQIQYTLYSIHIYSTHMYMYILNTYVALT